MRLRRGPVTTNQGRAPSHRRPHVAFTVAGLRWRLTKAPRPRLTDPSVDLMRTGLLLAVLLVGALALAASDFLAPETWWQPLRGLVALGVTLTLVWVVVAYLKRPTSEAAKGHQSPRGEDRS